MSAAKHTPGPWAILTGKTAAGETITEVCVEANFAPLATLSGDGSKTLANAFLFAAAPDLLQVARTARETLANALSAAAPDMFGTDADIAEHRTIKALDSAIAKATGVAA